MPRSDAPRPIAAAEPVEVSVVIPLRNEAESLSALVEGVQAALAEEPSWELLLVNDGSTDETPRLLSELAASDPRVRAVNLARNYGQTAAMQAGFDLARGRVVVSMDGDLQNDPADIPHLVTTLRRGYDMVCGYRQHRQDRFLTRKVPSWVANHIIRLLTGVPIRDNGCSLKAYRGDLVGHLHLYSDMHRFIPAVAAALTGARIVEIPVNHRSRQHGYSKYGLSRTWKVFLDLLVIKMIRSFRERPLILFGAFSLMVLLASVAVAVQAISAMFRAQPQAVFASVTAILFGLAVYLVMLGLLAEAVIYHGRLEMSAQPPRRDQVDGSSPQGRIE